MLDQLAAAFTNVTVRIVTRYLIAAFVALGLGQAAEGQALVGNPAVQAVLVTFVGGLAAWLIERGTVLARRYGRPT